MYNYLLLLISNLLINLDLTFSVTVVTNTTSTINPPPPIDSCRVYKSCADCLGKLVQDNVKCFWCYENKTNGGVCLTYPTDTCPFGNSRWGVCWVSYDILILCLSILLVIVILSTCLCVYCYCKGVFRRRATRREEVENRRQAADAEERQTRSDQRSAERRVKYDEIRKKYGLPTNSTGQYSRFDNEDGSQA